jgi:hypothetical protein
MQRDWDKFDEEAAREGQALKNSFRRSRIKDGSSKVSLKDQAHDYRNVADPLATLNVIDGRIT